MPLCHQHTEGDIFAACYIRWVAWIVELSADVLAWYRGLTPRGAAAADKAIGLLEERGHLLRMPHSRPLGDGLHELRFTCEGQARRITYKLEPRRRVIMLTTFRKQRDNERREIIRARRALRSRSSPERSKER